MKAIMSQDRREMTEEEGSVSGRSGSSRLRKCNVAMLMASVVLLMVLCGLLLNRIYSLNEMVDHLTAQAEKMGQVIEGQRSQLAQMELMEEKIEELLAYKEAYEAGRPGNKDVLPGDREDIEEPEVTAAHKVYLTFDDGPSIYTQDILDILEEYGVKATFFILGKENESAREAMKRIVADGHTLAMHSYTHKYADIYASVENFAEDFAKIQNYIYDVTGVTSTVYRFPGGSSNSVSPTDMSVFAEYLEEQDVRYFDWNISSGDGGKYIFPVETLLENCTSKISSYETCVILMHDSAGKKTTVEALPQIIETILAMEDTVILPITDSTEPIQHRKWQTDKSGQTDRAGQSGGAGNSGQAGR